MLHTQPHTQPQTSAHPAPIALSYTGTLLRPAEVRTAVEGDHHSVPILCMEVALDNALRTHVHVEQTYPPGCHDLCLSAARKYKSGSRVTWTVPLIPGSVALINRHVTYIEVLHIAAADAPVAPAVADLFA